MEAFIQELIHQLPYLGVVLVLIAGGLGVPIPEDVPLLIGGYLCGVGKAELAIMLPTTFIAVIGADLMVYGLGRRYGHHVPKLPVIRKYLSPQRLTKAEISFHKHGGKTLFLARFMPGLRTPIYFSAGAFKIPFWKMLLFDGTAAGLSVPTLVLVAWYLGTKVDLETLQSWSLATQSVLVAGLIVLVIAVLGWKRVRGRRLASVG